MRYGPCGGVRNDGGCEVDGRHCPFLDAVPEQPRAATALFIRVPEPMIVVDVRAPNVWRGDERALWRETATMLHGCIALIGEHVDNPALHDDSGALSPQEVIEILASGGIATIATVTGRDRDIESATQTMRRFRDAGATAIHCVTGDHPAALGLDRAVWFGTEAMELIGAAVSESMPACVAESPASPGLRVERLRAKEIAGASLCILNHSGDSADLGAFAERAARAGVKLPLIAPVPMIGDKRGALGLANFPGVRLPPGYLDAIVDATDSSAEGLRCAAALARTFAATGRFAGINLSGSASSDDPWKRLASTRQFIECVRSHWTSPLAQPSAD